MQRLSHVEPVIEGVFAIPDDLSSSCPFPATKTTFSAFACLMASAMEGDAWRTGCVKSNSSTSTIGALRDPLKIYEN